MNDTLRFIGNVPATDGTIVDLWHWPNCRTCGASRYGGAEVTDYCFSCEVNQRPAATGGDSGDRASTPAEQRSVVEDASSGERRPNARPVDWRKLDAMANYELALKEMRKR